MEVLCDMICYKNNPSNSDYIMFSVADRLKISSDNSLVENEINRLDEAVSNYEKELFLFDNISVRKDSILGSYFLNHPEGFQEYISYSDIVGAFDISIFTKNMEMANKVLPLFLSQRHGMRSELDKYYSNEVLNYIGQNSDFPTFLRNKNGEDSNYVVYDDGTLFLESNLRNIKMNTEKCVKK